MPGMIRKEAAWWPARRARADGSLDTFLGVHSNLCMGALNILGSDEQKRTMRIGVTGPDWLAK